MGGSYSKRCGIVFAKILSKKFPYKKLLILSCVRMLVAAYARVNDAYVTLGRECSNRVSTRFFFLLIESFN